ncbi:uncharacterized protein Z518_02762 [Rhinocladiella mackenziei CBS 650.93]|uniref:Diacylglycerol O-acyltransferase n=1 Tax=Rhinocladiella mackenziei CBS 650.93 TaxID=1442369 RepID=A0A0D2IXM4_9EURO|nr:uncharacterized protein Z518_02762 [Rhinocladiella mackenziei CBS 650.93]KIX08106.1 hypothetical protein Z518_02762 [Rhinocladiella mackenziei CBS 650.93]
MTDPAKEQNIVGSDPMSALSSESVSSVSPSSPPHSIISSNPSEDQDDQTRIQPVQHNGFVVDSGPNALHLDAEVDGDVGRHGPGGPEHIIHISSIERCMPRSYIRICLAYRLPDPDMLPEVEKKLNSFIRRTIDAKPYLCGYVVAVREPGNRVGAIEVRFSDRDFVEFPRVNFRRLTHAEVPYSYDDLDRMGLPPSIIKPELISALAESADEDRAPVFRVQANLVEGGLIVSVYLHHCISDGTGIGMLISGSVLKDEFTFDRPVDADGHDMPGLSSRLHAYANRKSVVREALSYIPENLVYDRQLKCKSTSAASPVNHPTRPRGRGCVVAFSLEKLAEVKRSLECHADGNFMTPNDVLLALLWHHMTRARAPSLLQSSQITHSKLLIPINIRNKLGEPLPESYFGAAIDFAACEQPIPPLANASTPQIVQTAMAIRKAINSVDEPYIRQAIALAKYAGPDRDVRDLQASNMDRANGADMYVTSWEKLKCYETTFDMDLGPPDWVRKPWSKDPGSCIVLPYDDRKEFIEVVIQMTEIDMERLLDDCEFMQYVVRVID